MNSTRQVPMLQRRSILVQSPSGAAFAFRPKRLCDGQFSPCRTPPPTPFVGDPHPMDHDEHSMMGNRGVSRPMAEMAMQHGQDDGDTEQHDHEHGGHSMSHDDRLKMLIMHHKQTLWVYWTILLL